MEKITADDIMEELSELGIKSPITYINKVLLQTSRGFKKLQSLASQYNSVTEMARELGCSNSHLSKLMRKHNVKFDKKQNNNDNNVGLSELSQKIYKHLVANERQWSVFELSELCDRSESSVRKAIDDIENAGYQIDVTDNRDQESVSLLRHTAPLSDDVRLNRHCEEVVKFGVVSDTHVENLCACTEELEYVYSLFEEEGITSVLHAGDLSDGPGERGYQGHCYEVQPSCQKFEGCVEYIIDNYPYRDEITTYFIESSKSHAGWEFKSSGRSIGKAISEGFSLTTMGPYGEEERSIEGRDDMCYLGFDEANIWVGPDANTKITLHHLDSGSSYTHQPQKWAESLSEGNDPHLAILGHYHKSNKFRSGNAQVLCPGCMCWQTPFMRRKKIAAEVASWIIEMELGSDGTILKFKSVEIPFLPPESRSKKIIYL